MRSSRQAGMSTLARRLLKCSRPLVQPQIAQEPHESAVVAPSHSNSPSTLTSLRPQPPPRRRPMTSRTVHHLKGEHQFIESVLQAFENYLERALSTAAQDHHELATLVDSISESLFLRHEEKEETILLPELARRGLSWSDGALAHVRQDHRHGRYLLRSLRHASRELRAWSPEQQRHVLAIGKEWVDFNRRHMALEESQLFPVLEGTLNQEDDARVAEHFELLDKEFAEMSDAKQLQEELAAFTQRYGQ